MLKADPPYSPRLPNQHADVLPGSPTALMAIFTEIVRERFRPGNDLAWVWEGTAIPRTGDAGTAKSPRRILIEPAYSETAEIRNFRPAIYVDKGPTQPGQIVTGNFVDQHLPSGARSFYSQARIPITISIEASRKGESGTLADAVWFYIMSAVEPIRATFNFHEISPPQLGNTVLIEKDKPGWVTQIMFAVVTNLRWTTTPISPVLQDIGTRLGLLPGKPAGPIIRPPGNTTPSQRPATPAENYPGRVTIETTDESGNSTTLIP